MTTPQPHCQTCTCNLIDAACARAAAAAAASADSPPSPAYYPGSHAVTPVHKPATTRSPTPDIGIGDGAFEGYGDGTYEGGEDGHDGTYEVGEGFDDE